MPKVELLLDAKRYRDLRVRCHGYFAESNRTRGDVGKALGVSGRMVTDYLDNPENMKLTQLLKMARNLNIPIEELRECIRY